MKAYLSATDNLFINSNAQPVEVDVCVIDDENDRYVLIIGTQCADDDPVFFCSCTDVPTFLQSTQNADQMVVDFDFGVNQYEHPTHVKCICNTPNCYFTYFELDIDIFDWNDKYVKQFKRECAMDVDESAGYQDDPDTSWIFPSTQYEKNIFNEVD